MSLPLSENISQGLQSPPFKGGFRRVVMKKETADRKKSRLALALNKAKAK